MFRPPLGRADIAAAINRLTLFRMGYSWGGVTSLVVTPDPADTPQVRSHGGRLARFHVGLEDPADLIADLDQAFRAAGGA